MNHWKMLLKHKCKKTNIWMWIAFSCPIIVIVFALITIMGWMTHSPALIQLIPNLGSMHSSTALCFFLCGISFLLEFYRKYKQLSILLAATVGLIATLTLMEDMLSINLGIDSLFINSFTDTPSIKASQMAPNSALAFIFISLSLILFHYNLQLSHYRALTISLFSSISFALGFTPLLGYLTGIETAYTWGQFTGMAIISAICFVLLNITIITYVWSRSKKGLLWLPLPVFIGFMKITLSMSAAMYTEELININQALEQAHNSWHSQYQTPINNRNSNGTISPQLKASTDQISNTYMLIFCFGFIMTTLLTLCTYLILSLYEKSKALFESEKSYRLILDGIKNYAIFMLTPHGNVKSWNNAAQKIKGYSEKEILGKHFSTFYTKEDIAQGIPETMLKIAKNKGRYKIDGLRVRKDGGHFWAANLIEPLYNTEKKLVGFVNITRDITDTRQMEQDRAKLFALIEESSDFVGIADLNGNLQYHNRSAKRMIGLPEDYDMSQLNITDMHPAWATKYLLEHAIPIVFEKGAWSGESALLHRNGKEIPILQSINLHRDTTGAPLCFTTIIRDITDLKSQEETLKASEETFRYAMQYASIGMALISTEGKWLKVNQSLCNMVGYSEEELLKTDFQSITHPDDLQRDLEYVAQMLNKEIEAYQMEKRYFHKDGHIIWILLNVSLLWATDGTPKYFISQVQNITRRKKTEKANKKLMKALANSNAELERFAYVASHDLQEPIRMITNFGEMLLTEKQELLDEEGKEYLTIITNASMRMHEMINDLLTYSRVDKETVQFVNFEGEEILKSVLENIKTLIAEQKAQITHDPLPKLYGNPMQIMRLLQNLITNAIKYQAPGNIPQIHIGLKDQGKNWQISIKDNGLGIEEQFIKEIFEPFRRLHTWESIQGSGFGLSICKKISEIHKGTLTIKSTPGKGSTFFFTLRKH